MSRSTVSKAKRCCKRFLSFVAMVKAIIARVIFFIHGLVAIWRVADITGEPLFWILSVALIALITEFLISLKFKGGNESKWFSPVVFLYLCSVVPAIWFLELDLLQKRTEAKIRSNLTVGPVISALEGGHEHGPEPNLSGGNKKHAEGLSGIHALGLDIHIPVIMAPSEWAKILEQLLMLFLIVGRWLLPKGDLTRDQLSQLLLVNIGMAADIIELFEAFREENVKYNKSLTIVILSLWTSSLMQFTLIMTATKARKVRVALTRTDDEDGNVRCYCCETEIWAIMTCLFMQDVPFLCLRMTLIFHFSVVSYMNIFFTCKNSLVILLQIYRIGVIHVEEIKKERRRKRGEVADEEEPSDVYKPPYTPKLHSCKGPPPRVKVIENNDYEAPSVKPVIRRAYVRNQVENFDGPDRPRPYFRRPPSTEAPSPRGSPTKRNYRVGELNSGVPEPVQISPSWFKDPQLNNRHSGSHIQDIQEMNSLRKPQPGNGNNNERLENDTRLYIGTEAEV